MRQLSLGIVLDYGFVRAYHGGEPALLAAALAVDRANEVFIDQLGIQLVVTNVVVNEELGGDLEATGPNDAPADGSTTRSCPLYMDREVEGHGVMTIASVDHHCTFTAHLKRSTSV